MQGLSFASFSKNEATKLNWWFSVMRFPRIVPVLVLSVFLTAFGARAQNPEKKGNQDNSKSEQSAFTPLPNDEKNFELCWSQLGTGDTVAGYRLPWFVTPTFPTIFVVDKEGKIRTTNQKTPAAKHTKHTKILK